MASPRNRRHIIVPGEPTVERYTPHGGGGRPKAPGPPGVGRPAHAAALTKALESARDTAALRRTTLSVDVTGAQPGLYLEFESFPGWELAIGSLENKHAKDPLRHIEVVAVNNDEPKDDSEPKTTRQRAAVFVPEGQVAHFVKQLERYAWTTPKAERERRHENTYDRIASIRLAALRGLWTDAEDAYPANPDELVWWEVWLRRTDGNELERLHDFAVQTNIRLGDRRLQFDDRIVTLAYTTASTLAMSLDVLGGRQHRARRQRGRLDSLALRRPLPPHDLLQARRQAVGHDVGDQRCDGPSRTDLRRKFGQLPRPLA